MPARALVTNAADRDQVQRAARTVDAQRRRFLNALRASLEHPEVRLVFAQLLEESGLEQSSFKHSGSEMYFDAGVRHFGLRLRKSLLDADEELVELMDKEQRARQRADDRATEASHTARAADGA